MPSLRMVEVVRRHLLSVLIFEVFQENGDPALEHIGLDVDLVSSVCVEDFKRVWGWTGENAKARHPRLR